MNPRGDIMGGTSSGSSAKSATVVSYWRKRWMDMAMPTAEMMGSNEFPGLLVTIEGVDGSGKSTLVSGAAEALEDVVTTREPAEHLWTGEQVRRAINDNDSQGVTDFFLFLADRAHHIDQTIQPALEAGKTVISDRYSDSTRAYQREVLAGHVEEPREFIEQNLDEPWHIEPDLTILIDISAEESARRTSEGDKYEKSEFISRVRENYRGLAENNNRIVLLDGNNSEEYLREWGLYLIETAQECKAASR